MYWKSGALIGLTLMGAVTFESVKYAPTQPGPEFTREVTVPSGHTARACDGGESYQGLIDDLPDEGDLAGWERLAQGVSEALDCTMWTIPGQHDSMMHSVFLARGVVGHAEWLQERGRYRDATTVLLDLWAVGQNLQDGSLFQHAIALAVQEHATAGLDAAVALLPSHQQRSLVEPILDILDRSPAIDASGELEWAEKGESLVYPLVRPFCKSGRAEAVKLVRPALASTGPHRFDAIDEAWNNQSSSLVSTRHWCQSGTVRLAAKMIWNQADLQQNAAVLVSELALQGQCPSNLSAVMSRVPVDPVTGAALAYSSCEVRPVDLPGEPMWM